MTIAVNIAIIVSACAAVAALAITVAVHLHGLKREIKLDTLNKYYAIRSTKVDKNSSEESKKEFLIELEYFAVGINKKVYDIEILARVGGQRLLRIYHGWVEEFIKKRRNKYIPPRKSAYREIDIMMQNLSDRVGKYCLDSEDAFIAK